MLQFEFTKRRDRSLNILCLGAHSDDIEIGCGGTILRFLDEYGEACAYWVVFSASAERKVEAEKGANLFLAQASRKDVVVKDFTESYFPYTGAEIKDYFESLKQEFSPHIVFTYCRNDLHQDHRLISELTWNTFRNHLILEYEIIKYDGDLGGPNLFIPLSREDARRKVDYVLQVFKSQGHRSWFTEDAFTSIMRIRGIECNAPEKYAEAFYCRKMVI